MPRQAYDHCSEIWFLAQWPTWLVLSSAWILAIAAIRRTPNSSAFVPVLASRLARSAVIAATVMSIGVTSSLAMDTEQIPDSGLNEHGCNGTFTGDYSSDGAS